MTPLLTYHRQKGATLNPTENAVVSFGTDEKIQGALKTGCVVGDRSHWGLIKFTGADRQRYLHNQSTNQIQQLQPGQSCETVLVTSTARTIDLPTVYVFTESLWLMVSPSKTEFLMEWFHRFLFPMDKVELANISDDFNTFTLLYIELNYIELNFAM